jgi:lysyl-tRNA synthetase class I
MDCTKCNNKLDDLDEETLAQINKYAALPILPICESCLQEAIEVVEWDEKRIDAIGQNGNNGEHYDA